jgi:coproporphyrinogen III oxidase-like Fe-S oxidoreductase
MMSNCVTQSHISVLASQHWLPIHVLKIDEQYINRPPSRYTPLFMGSKMEIDVNIEAHDLLWRSMSLRIKKAYRESYGVARDELVDTEVQRLIEAGYVVKSDKGVELTPAGKELHRKMMTICKKSE